MWLSEGRCHPQDLSAAVLEVPAGMPGTAYCTWSSISSQAQQLFDHQLLKLGRRMGTKASVAGTLGGSEAADVCLAQS